jgi:transcriptional repressor NrdR
MQCPFCGVQDTKVIDSRLVGEGNQVRRRRECIVCNDRFTTYEIIELSLPRILKNDGSFEQFKEDKLRSGFMRALEKRKVSIEKVDIAVNNVIKKLQTSGDREIKSSLMGELVMQELIKLDEVAYLRFASVYRKFKEAEEFYDEITRMKGVPGGD